MRDAGVEVTVLPALEAFPDSVFVEDPALVFTEGAILLRPGAETRMQETAEIAPTLRDLFNTVLDLLPDWMLRGLAGQLFGRQWFARRVVLDEWFFHRQQPPMDARVPAVAPADKASAN